MEGLADTTWDVVIEGTGLEQSLLALKILHVDRNEYYGDEEAALTLQELDQWVQQVNDASRLGSSSFSKAHILQPNTRKPEELSFSRAYSLSLSPLIIYCSSPILPLLVSSQVYRQVEFLAVGSWWILDESGTKDASPSSSSDGWSLSKIPSGREDVFSDDTVSLKHKRALMKFLKFIQSYEAQRSLWKAYDTRPLPEFLSSEYFELPDSLQKQLFATSLSALPMQETETGWAIEMIARHLRSIGIFSAGIGSVVPKWGGMGEICQVACRACAVGGGTYVLKKGISDVEVANDSEHMGYKKLNVRLDGGETVETQYLSRSNKIKGGGNYMEAHHSISIINSSLHHLFPSFGEDEPTPAVAMVVIPTGLGGGAEHHPPVYIQVHSSETGECPQGQCVLYTSTLASQEACQEAVEGLLKAHVPAAALPTKENLQIRQQTSSLPTGDPQAPTAPPSAATPEVLWRLSYTRRHPSYKAGAGGDTIGIALHEDVVLGPVMDEWETILGKQEIAEKGLNFLMFEDRNAAADEGNELDVELGQD